MSTAEAVKKTDEVLKELHAYLGDTSGATVVSVKSLMREHLSFEGKLLHDILQLFVHIWVQERKMS